MIRSPDLAPQFVLARADRLQRWCGGSDWPIHQPKAASKPLSFTDAFAAAQGDPLVNAALIWGQLGSEMGERWRRVLARFEVMSAMRTAQAGQVAAAPARVKALRDVPTLDLLPRIATLKTLVLPTPVRVRRPDQLSDRDLAEQLVIARRAAKESTWTTLSTYGRTHTADAVIAAARARHAELQSRVDELQAEHQAREQQRADAAAAAAASKPVSPEVREIAARWMALQAAQPLAEAAAPNPMSSGAEAVAARFAELRVPRTPIDTPSLVPAPQAAEAAHGDLATFTDVQLRDALSAATDSATRAQAAVLAAQLRGLEMAPRQAAAERAQERVHEIRAFQLEREQKAGNRDSDRPRRV